MGTISGPRGRRATMRDVATLAGVSLSTVSRVVNGSRVDAKMTTRVHDAIATLGYRPNLTATRLRRSDGMSVSIGLIVEDVANPFFSAIHRGVENVLRTRGMLTFAGSSDESGERERELAAAFSARGVDGLIIVPTAGGQGYLARDRDAGMVLVFVDRPPRFFDADYVVSDNYRGALVACESLIAHGHRRIAFLGDRPEIHTSIERLRGYRDALGHHGLPLVADLIRHPRYRATDAYETARELLLARNPPTALFTSQNLITLEAVSALHHLELHERVALVGFDDVTLSAAVKPSLTVVAQDPLALGRHAAELLLARLDGDASATRHITLPPTLIERGSGEIRRSASRRPLFSAPRGGSPHRAP